jgi:hypothetical protein
MWMQVTPDDRTDAVSADHEVARVGGAVAQRDGSAIATVGHGNDIAGVHLDARLLEQ